MNLELKLPKLDLEVMENPEIIKLMTCDVNVLQEEIYADARNKGWYQRKCELPGLLMGIHAEVSEAYESYRRNEPAIWIDKDGKLQGYAIELADVSIVTMSVSAHLDIQLGRIIAMKMIENRGRSFRHGGKRC